MPNIIIANIAVKDAKRVNNTVLISETNKLLVLLRAIYLIKIKDVTVNNVTDPIIPG